ncbi:MAG TPA: type II secretion system F family protein [Thermaerobacter sp.]
MEGIAFAAAVTAATWVLLSLAVAPRPLSRRGSGESDGTRFRPLAGWWGGNRLGPGRGAGTAIIVPGRAAAARLDETLEALLLAVVAGLQAGRPLRQAWLTAAHEVDDAVLEPGRTEFIAGLNAGWSLEDALGHWHRRTGSVAFRRCQTVAAAHRRAGGHVNIAMLAILKALRQERLARAEIRARAAEAHLSARLLVLVPLAIAAYGVAVDPDLMAPLLNSAVGRLGLLYAGLSWATGLWLLHRLVASVEGGEGG